MISDQTVARIDGVSFFGTRPVDGFALVRMDGWSSPTAVRGETIERPAADGEFDMPVYRGARLITMSGWARVTALNDLADLESRFAAILADGKSGRLVVSEYGRTLHALVRVYGQSTFARRGSTRYADWSLKLRAADPWRYGKLRTFAAGVPAAHAGNAPASPVFTVVGPQPAYSISAGSRQFAVSTALPAGSTDVIDLSTGWVRRNGAVLVDGVSRAETWTIPPGPTGVIHGFSGTASRFSGAVRDTHT
ncbi:hypothetical protein [Microbacterium sp. 3J1]|uniref:hypothetical protein n=1 Tax=Microbacterium sp. 3J1 TaxID=861269 RepID=UPI000ACE2168|nr:hypothetical protein [Microbacterium sp. 3J1]